MKFKLK